MWKWQRYQCLCISLSTDRHCHYLNCTFIILPVALPVLVILALGFLGVCAEKLGSWHEIPVCWRTYLSEVSVSFAGLLNSVDLFHQVEPTLLNEAQWSATHLFDLWSCSSQLYLPNAIRGKWLTLQKWLSTWSIPSAKPGWWSPMHHAIMYRCMCLHQWYRNMLWIQASGIELILLSVHQKCPTDIVPSGEWASSAMGVVMLRPSTPASILSFGLHKSGGTYLAFDMLAKHTILIQSLLIPPPSHLLCGVLHVSRSTSTYWKNFWTIPSEKQ